MHLVPSLKFTRTAAFLAACALSTHTAVAKDDLDLRNTTVPRPDLNSVGKIDKIPVLRQPLDLRLQQCHDQSSNVTVLPIVAVLSADDDGSKSMSEVVGGSLVPKAPWLRAPAGGPSLLPKGHDDYILEWVRETNGVLARSGATFRLGEDIAYVAEKSSLINAGRDGDGVAMNAYFAKKRAAPGPDNPYAHRMIMLFAWGQGAEPFGGGASDIRSNFVAMPGRVDGGTRLEGKSVPGWNMMAHEMGHHLGLQHTFAGLEDMLSNLALGYKIVGVTQDKDGRKQPQYGGSPHLDSGYGPWTPTKDELARIEEIVKDYPYAFDQDQFPVTDDTGKLTYADGVSDTGIDLGLGLAALKGVSPCATLTNASLGQLEGLDNSVNHFNPMSYSVCPVSTFRYSPDQVKVMEASLKHADRALFVTHRTQVTQVCSPMQWKAGPGHVKPGEPVMRGREPMLRVLPPAVQGARPVDAGVQLKQ